MSNKPKTLYIWDGGVFSPPTRAVGKLAFNTATYLSSKFDDKYNIEYHFVPTNKYYNKPWVRCVEEEDRLHMLRNLVKFIMSNYNVPSNIKFIVNETEINHGKKYKESRTTLESLTFFSKNEMNNVYVSGSIENIIQRLKGYWQDTLKLLFSVNSIVFDIFSQELVGVNQTEEYVYKSINLGELLKSNKEYPEKIKQYLKSHKLSNTDIQNYITSNKKEEQFIGLKELIMDRILFLPKHLVPSTYKATAGNRVREELDMYYSSLKNIQNFTTPGIEKYITDKKLYEHCKSRYVDKLVSKKTKTKRGKTKRGKTKRSKTKRSKTKRGK
jgi:hypothetical protein